MTSLVTLALTPWWITTNLTARTMAWWLYGGDR